MCVCVCLYVCMCVCGNDDRSKGFGGSPWMEMDEC